MIHCNSIVHIVAQNKWIRKIFDPFIRWRIQENIQTNKQSDSTPNAFGLIYYDVLLVGQHTYENNNKWLCTLSVFKFPLIIVLSHDKNCDVVIDRLDSNRFALWMKRASIVRFSKIYIIRNFNSTCTRSIRGYEFGGFSHFYAKHICLCDSWFFIVNSCRTNGL